MNADGFNNRRHPSNWQFPYFIRVYPFPHCQLQYPCTWTLYY